MMNENKSSANELEDSSRVLHLGLTVFGISARATGLWADEYKRVEAGDHRCRRMFVLKK